MTTEDQTKQNNSSFWNKKSTPIAQM